MKAMIQNNKALKVMYDQAVVDRPLFKRFMEHTEKFVIELGSDENTNTGGVGPNQNTGEFEVEKYYVPANMDEGTLQMLRTMIRDREVVRVEKKEWRRYRQIDY